MCISLTTNSIFFTLAAAIMLQLYTARQSYALSILKQSQISNSGPRQADFPWFAMVVVNDSRGPTSCSGTLVHSQWVITAANCVRKSSTAVVYFGFWDTINLPINPARFIHATNISIHRCKNSRLFGGVQLAMLKLASPVNYLSPVCLPVSYEEDSSRLKRGGNIENCISLGYESTGSSTTFNLQRVDFPSVSNRECQWLPGYINSSDKVCSSAEDSSSACLISRGAPLLCRTNSEGCNSWYLAGINLVQHSDCRSGSNSAVFMTLFESVPWILATIDSTSTTIPDSIFGCFKSLIKIIM